MNLERVVENVTSPTESVRKPPRISVVTVVRNDLSNLRRTFASVLQQQYRNVEYVVIDGASTDGCAEFIRGNAEHLHGWLTEPDRGLYDAMNKGKSMASGDFVMFLNAGDTFDATDTLAKVAAHIARPDILLFGNVSLSHAGRQWRVPRRSGSDSSLPKGYVPHHQTVLYPRCFFRDENYDLELRVVGDADYTCRAMKQVPTSYIDVDMVRSSLGGFTFRMYGSLRGTLRIVKERRIVYRRHASQYSRFHAASLAGMVFAKYLAINLGGIALATWLMQWKTKVGPLRSLGHGGCNTTKSNASDKS